MWVCPRLVELDEGLAWRGDLRGVPDTSYCARQEVFRHIGRNPDPTLIRPRTPSNAPIDLAEKLSSFTDHWSPKVVARLNDYEIKVVKVQGEFVWHTHDDTDELFLVVDGELTIQLRDGNVALHQVRRLTGIVTAVQDRSPYQAGC